MPAVRGSGTGFGERGSGTVLALATVGLLVGLTAGVLTVAGAHVAHRRTAAAADAAALAAADTAVGRVPGEPCGAAAKVAEATGATVERCELEEVVATVTVSVDYLGFRTSASARAGPPGTP